MNWPSFGGFRLTRARIIVIAAILLDILLTLTGRLESVATLITLFLIAWGGWKVIRLLQDRTLVIWKVRNRLIVTYLFIAVVPIILLLAFFLVAGWTLTAQFAGYIVGSAMQNQEAMIETPARLLVRELPADRIAIVQQLTAKGVRFEALVMGNQTFRYPSDATIEMPPGDWKDYTGVVYKDNLSYLMSLVTNGRNRALILLPLTREVLENLASGLGSLGMPGATMQLTPGDSPLVEGGMASYKNAVAGRVPPQQNVLDFVVTGVSPIGVATWNRSNSTEQTFMLIATRLSAVLGVVFPDKSLGFVLYVFYAIIFLLGVTWLVSLFIGISMTRTVTGAVHHLYEGTTRIGEGDFVHRIPVPKGRDQLADLGRSFNKMAEQLEHYVVVTKEKERLQSEIAIASEVQTRLFPARPPAAETIEMLGVCHAARMVSGDYYDYFTAADGEIALALGDVAGKGISAALLMASIQSIMRTQLSDGSAVKTPAQAVARLNRLLYASTSPEKYATFFFGLYNEQTRRLNYTNAGHLPPLLIRGDDYEFLEVTGSVVGAFPSLPYEEQSVPLGPGDLLIAYTDGITEPENEYGEDFGADRLAEVVLQHRDAGSEEIVARILDAVRHWDASEEQADDMTLMIMRGIG